MPRKLKVFQARLGFYDSVVAAPSRAAALRAWGTHLNLFADGMAQEASDEQAIAAALAQPEVPLRRAVGTSDPFSLEPGLPRLPDGAGAQKRPPKLRLVPTGPKAEPDRTALTSAEAALRRVEQENQTEQEALREKRAQLEAEEKALKQRQAELAASEAAVKLRHERARRSAEKILRREQEAYARAGGQTGAKPEGSRSEG
jgi:type IV secretory pathway VirB10-like protein